MISLSPTMLSLVVRNLQRRALIITLASAAIAGWAADPPPPVNEPQNPDPSSTINKDTKLTPALTAGAQDVAPGDIGRNNTTRTGILDMPEAAARHAALSPEEQARVEAQVEGMKSSLDKIVSGFFSPDSALDSAGDIPATIARQNMVAHAELAERAKGLTGNSPENFTLITLPWDYGITASSSIRPFNERKYPTYPDPYPLTNYGADLTQKVNKEMQRAKNALKSVGIGTCSAFDWGTEFTALFNRETLSNMLKNLKEGVIAAAPMAIIQVLSTDLANIVQHLKAMASAALAVSKMECGQIQGIMTDQMSKMFNGPKYAECMDGAASSGLSTQDANRLCADTRAVKELPLLGFENVLSKVQTGGAAVNNFLGDTNTVIASGGNMSYDQAQDMRTNQVAALSQAQLDMQTSKSTAKYAADQRQAAIRACGSDAKCLAEKMVFVHQLEDDAKQLREASYAKVAMASEATAAKCARDPTLPECAGLIPAKNNGDKGGAATSFVDGVNGYTNDAKSFYESVKNSNRILSSTAGFLEDYFGAIVTRPQVGVGLEIGRYSYKFNLAKIGHAQAQISWDIEDKLIAIYRAYRDCKPTLSDDLLTLEVYLYGLGQQPWKDLRTKTLSPMGATLLNNRALYDHANAYCDRETMIKLAYKFYLSKQSGPDASILASHAFIKEGRDFGIHEALKILTDSIVGDYLYHYITTDQKVIKQIDALRTSIGSMNHVDAKATIEKYLEEGFSHTDKILIPLIDNAVPVLIAINADPMPPRYCAPAPFTATELGVQPPNREAIPRSFDENSND